MKIDGKALTLAETREINEIINAEWTYSTSVDREGFIVGSFGPNAIELLIGGSLWIVCDRDLNDMITYQEGHITWVAYHELFKTCAKHTKSIEVEQKTPVVLNTIGYDSPSFAISHRPFN